MSGDDARWLPDPVDATRWRWWDGRRWTDRVGRDGVEVRDPLPRAVWWRRVPVWAWIVIAVLAVPVIVLLWPVLVLLALVLVIVGVVALATGRPTWLRLRSRGTAGVLTASAAAFLLIAGGIGAIAAPAVPAPPSPGVVAGSEASVGPTPARSTAPVAAAAQTRASSPTPAPTRTPVTLVREESVATAIPFERVSVEDGTIPQGESRITTSGADGEKIAVYRVTTVDGVETTRELVSEIISREAVAEVTSIGTYVAPPPVVEAQPESNGCHTSYADACVPIDSDVDCAGGTGNGPSYFSGVARVVGPDVYDLDRNGDGWACES